MLLTIPKRASIAHALHHLFPSLFLGEYIMLAVLLLFLRSEGTYSAEESEELDGI